MIIWLKQGCDPELAYREAQPYYGHLIHDEGRAVLVISGKIKDLPEPLAPYTEKFVATGSDFQLASRMFKSSTRRVDLGGGVVVGGDTRHCVLITGPCSVESEAQIESCAQLCVETGVKILRAGAFKPRTAPYSFQGLGIKGLELLAKMREKYGLSIITEVRDATHVEAVIEYSDIIQVGAKAMYDQGILRACGRITKPVLIKRGFGTTLQELVQASEFVLAGGNPNVLVCERGIRTFETKTRFTLDLCGVAWLKEYANLPVVLDPSHAMGYAYGVPDLARACLAMGVDGLLIETHPCPSEALSDAAQQLNFDQFKNLALSLRKLAPVVDRHLV
ncbi:MAG: 3-deoxy-7-phosphoheptulonate synthase [Flavobacteriales bacterium]|nr:3-deoxy-7-phosphoheptulonate synthase [Flavobacteriales bacterium]MDW8433002.1 3-deoxy-7-phosphoheptulonate synthase [Flavobacteriales bacterium]